MTIDEAIEILEDSFAAQPQFADNPYHQAIRLGIEALKLYMALKATGGVPRGFSGIGETKD